MPRSLRIRLVCVAVLAGVCGLWSQSSTFLWTTYAFGFSHYLLALRYSTTHLRQVATASGQMLALAGLVLLSSALYQVSFPLFLYFGLHHALNEAYARRPALASPASVGRLNAAATVFHALAYLTVLRWAPELAGVDPLWIWAGFAAGTAGFLWTVARPNGLHATMISERAGRPRSQPIPFMEVYAPELAAAALVVLSLFVRVTFLQVVFYHFVLWAVLPIDRLRQRGGRALADYAVASVALLGAALLLSPLGPEAVRLRAAAFSEQFLFWSYLHITLSFALSDAHPFWVARLFRGVTSPPVTLFHTGRPAAS